MSQPGARLVIAVGFVVGCKGAESPSCAKVAAHMHALMSSEATGGGSARGDLVAKIGAEIEKALEAECVANDYPPTLRRCIVAARTENDMMPCLGAPKATLTCPTGAHLVGPRPVERDAEASAVRRTFEMRGNDEWVEQCVADGVPHGPYRKVTIADPESMFVREEITGAHDRGEKSGTWKTTIDQGRVVEQGDFTRGMKQGMHTLWDRSGAKVLEATYKDDRPHGELRRWHAGQLVEEHHFSDGAREGASVEWHPGGAKKSELVFAADTPTGKHLAWHANGKPSAEGAYADGVLHGAWREWSEDGKPTVEGTYARGKRTGVWKTYRVDGSPLSAGAWVDDERRGAWTYFDGKGAPIASFTIGADDTLAIETNDDGMPVEIDMTAADGTRTHLELFATGAIKVRGGFKGEERHGRWVELDRDGNKIVDLAYRDGKKHGAAASYHEGTAQLADQGTMVDGEWDGPWKQWYDSGTLRMEGVYVAGKRDGLWTEYHPKGHKWREGRFRLGQKIGTWTTWDANAKVADVEEKGE